jgi:hypothetical protein
MSIEMLLINGIQFFSYSNDFKLSKGNKCTLCTLLKFLKSKFESFHLNKISIRYKFSKFMFL